MTPAKTLNDRTVIELESGKTYAAKVVVGSDGMNSYTRDVHGIQTAGYSYNQHGIVATLKMNQPLPGAFQRFLSSGPVALLPLWNNYATLVWSVPTNLAEDLKQDSEEGFITALNNSFYSEPKNPVG